MGDSLSPTPQPPNPYLSIMKPSQSKGSIKVMVIPSCEGLAEPEVRTLNSSKYPKP